MYVARSISGPTPCETNPFAPCRAWKSFSSRGMPTFFSAADDIFRARTKSTGYIIVAVASAPAEIGGSVLHTLCFGLAIALISIG